MSIRFVSEPVGEPMIIGPAESPTGYRHRSVKSDRGIERLRTSDNHRPSSASIRWDLIDATIQDALGRLTERIAEAVPDLKWKAGSYSARFVALTSYRVFYHLDGDDFDPVYVGITLVEDDAGVRVSGDVSGDETGHVYFDEGCELRATRDPSSLMVAATEVSDRLSAQDRVIVDAIRCPRNGASVR